MDRRAILDLITTLLYPLMRYLYLDIETTTNADTPTKSDGLDPHRGRIRTIAFQEVEKRTSGSDASPTVSYDDIVLLDLFTDPRERIDRVLMYLALVWRDPDFTILGVNILFDTKWLYWKYPLHFNTKDRKCQIVPVDLIARTFMGDYRDTGVSGVTTSKSKAKESVYKYARVIAGYSLANLYEQITGEPLSKEERSTDWSIPELTDAQKQYAKQDVIATRIIHEYFLSLVTPNYKVKPVRNTFTVAAQALLSNKQYTRTALHNLTTELEAVSECQVLNTHKYHVDRNYLLETQKEIEDKVEWWEERFAELEPDLTPTQAVKLAAKYHLRSVDRNTYTQLLMYEETKDKEVLLDLLALQANITAEQADKIADKLVGMFDDLASGGLENAPNTMEQLTLPLSDAAPVKSDEAIIALWEDDSYRQRVTAMLRCRVAYSAAKKSLNDCQSLLGLFAVDNDGIGVNYCSWSSCNGSGRSTSSNSKTVYPNLQAIKTRETPIENTSANIRKGLVAKPGYVFIHIDAPTIHARIAFALSKCTTGIRMLEEGVDIHSYFGSKLYNLRYNDSLTWQEFKQLTKTKSDVKAIRVFAKNTFFGRLNRAGSKRIHQQITNNLLAPIDYDMIDALRESIDKTFPELGAFCQFVYDWLRMHPIVIPGELSEDGNTRWLYALTTCPALMILPEKYRPNLTFPGIYYNDNQTAKLPSYTQVPAAIWARIETLIMKAWLAHIRNTYTYDDCHLIVNVYDGVLFEVRQEIAEQIAPDLVDLFDEYLSYVLPGCPTGIDDDYRLNEVRINTHW